MYLWISFSFVFALICKIRGIEFYSLRELSVGGRLLYICVVSIIAYILYLIIQKQILPEKKLIKIIKDYKSISFNKPIFIALFVLIHIFFVGTPVLILALFHRL
jgi:hypothetical protein